MLQEELLCRKKQFHEIYDARLASANGKKEAMARDLADFDKGIELLLQGVSYREGPQEMERFSTVYGWITGRNLPQSFRDFAEQFKKISTSQLSDSLDFVYLVSVYQAKVRDIALNRYNVVTGDVPLARRVEHCFKSLYLQPSVKDISFSNNSRHATRVYFNSTKFMSCISEITKNNTCIPGQFYIPASMLMYLSAFFDVRAVPFYSSRRIKSSSILRHYPKIVITKTGRPSLLSSVNASLHVLGINSNYDSQSRPGQIQIDELASIKKFIDLGLFRSSEKMARLKEAYAYWEKTKELDYNGAYNKLKEQILLERGSKMEKYVAPEPEEEDDEDYHGKLKIKRLKK